MLVTRALFPAATPAEQVGPGAGSIFVAEAPAARTAETVAGPSGKRVKFLNTPFDTAPALEVLTALGARSERDRFAYVVTPNVDHVARLAGRPELRPIYDAAWMCWCDSQPIRRLAQLFGLALPHLNGTDVTVRVLAELVQPSDRLLLITASESLLARLRRQLMPAEVIGLSPPPGLDGDERAFARCVEFIVAHPARFIFIGVGSPQSERLAHAVSATGAAFGTAFCIGAALEFVAGDKRRAPLLFQRLGLEWLHRLLQEPRRLWRRYTLTILPLLLLVIREAARHRRRAAHG